MNDPTGGYVGPKQPASGRNAVCSSQSPIVTETMLNTMKAGGNAVDAAIAGCMVQATVQQDMTNHTGTVTFLMYEAATGELHQLNAMGTVVPDLPPLHRVPHGHGYYASFGQGPFAVIPGFMPGMKAMYERWGTLPWAQLCEAAIHYAAEGHIIGSFEHLVTALTVDFYLYTQSGRDHFTEDGFLPEAGDRWAQPTLAETLRRTAEEGPDYFIRGQWGQDFVALANDLGWKITLDNMDDNPPRWTTPLSFPHRGYDICQLSPPERQVVYCAIVLGILRELDLPALGHYSESAEAAYYFSHALRRAHYETGFINDPEVFEDPTSTLMDPSYHAHLANIIQNSRSKIDLTNHINITKGPNALLAAGAARPANSPPESPAGSCELSIVDSQGNWVQMMNTLQSGGIPGEVLGGVPMVGSHGFVNLQSPIMPWFTGGGRMRSLIGNTIVLKDGQPRFSLGSPGNIHCTAPQVLSNLLDFNLPVPEALDKPRMLPLEEDYKLPIESRVSPEWVSELARLGVVMKPLPRYDFHMGTFQTSWRDDDGLLHSTAGPRRAGNAAGY